MGSSTRVLDAGLKLIHDLERSYEILGFYNHREDEQARNDRNYYHRTERLSMQNTFGKLENWATGFFRVFDKSVSCFDEWYSTAQAAGELIFNAIELTVVFIKTLIKLLRKIKT